MKLSCSTKINERDGTFFCHELENFLCHCQLLNDILSKNNNGLVHTIFSQYQRIKKLNNCNKDT